MSEVTTDLEGALRIALARADSQEFEWRRVAAERDEIAKHRDSQATRITQLEAENAKLHDRAEAAESERDHLRFTLSDEGVLDVSIEDLEADPYRARREVVKILWEVERLKEFIRSTGRNSSGACKVDHWAEYQALKESK